MTLPDWVNYLSLVCGVGGLALSYFAYRRSGQMKAIDLRLELRKIDADLHGLLKRLPARLDHTRGVHEAVSAMSGSHGSNAVEQWQVDWDADKKHLAQMAALLPPAHFDYQGLKPVELATQLVTRHEIFSRIKIIQEKYESSLAEDDRQREEARTQRTQPLPP